MKLLKYIDVKAFLEVIRFLGFLYNIDFKSIKAVGGSEIYYSVSKLKSQILFCARTSLYFLPGKIDLPRRR